MSHANAVCMRPHHEQGAKEDFSTRSDPRTRLRQRLACATEALRNTASRHSKPHSTPTPSVHLGSQPDEELIPTNLSQRAFQHAGSDAVFARLAQVQHCRMQVSPQRPARDSPAGHCPMGSCDRLSSSSAQASGGSAMQNASSSHTLIQLRFSRAMDPAPANAMDLGGLGSVFSRQGFLRMASSTTRSLGTATARYWIVNSKNILD